MWKQQIDAAGVELDWRLAEETQRHRRALEVPAGAARTEAVIPRRLFRLWRLPQHEVAGALLLVLVDINAGAVLHALVRDARELAVFRKRRDLEVDRPVAPVRVA